jgi:rare lipoprotein A
MRARSFVVAAAPRALLAVALAVAAACATSRPRASFPAVERGVASWYGPGFHGRDTASGEPYDMHAMTAAHRTLPFGTLVEVRSLDSGLATRVRINDRGPFRKNRIIDLSNAAAAAIGMIGPGTARVEIRIVTLGAAKGRFAVQVGAFQERALADDLYERLRGAYPGAAVRSDEVWHRVQVGAFDDRAEAESLRRALERAGYTALVVAVSGAPGR